MEMRYSPKTIEPKWQREWDNQGTFRQYDREKTFYVLDMFPYPSGAGLHVGHPKGYISTDVVARMKQLQGYGVLHPMGWDAFGLPAEQYAIKNKVHPSVAVERNIATFKGQLGKIGFTYDWDREINTTDPEYYRFTQWIFLKMFERGLAYESWEPINWCPSCQTGLANEDLEDGACERCGTIVAQKPMRQWVLRMTAYADRLLADLDRPELDWEEQIKNQQRNWIGRSEGVLVKFQITNPKSRNTNAETEYIEVFTTRVDTIFSGTYLVLAPEHPLIEARLGAFPNADEVAAYVESAKKKTDIDRLDVTKEKAGVELKGLSVINPATGEAMPVWVSDFVLGHYGTGAVFADAHDERDWEFAKKYGIPLKESIAPLFCTTTGPDAVRPGVETIRRKTAFTIVKHWSEDKYLCLDWEKFGWHSGIIGGIEDDEDAIEAGTREIIEESGYRHPEFVRYVGRSIHTNFYAAHKGVNRYADGVGMLFQLKDDTWSDPEPEETKNHKAIWIDGEKMEEFLNLSNFRYMWDIVEHGERPFVEDGILYDSAQFDGMTSAEARVKITEWLVEQGLAEKTVRYKMWDWVFSRQRYWGEPIPIVHCEKCGVVPVPEKDLPVRLPDVESYEPTGTGESPLADIAEWVNTTCPACGGPAKRETNTMPQWAGSSWYYLRYIDTKNVEALVGKEAERKWMPVDLYVGGAEHAARHLLYARFWHKFLFDIGVVSTDEPFRRFIHVGLINASDGRKMSKRWGNVVNPDDIVEEFGADALRLYEMFMGPFTQNIAWNTEGLIGTRRFLEKVWNLAQRTTNDEQSTEESGRLTTLLHQTIKKVTEDIDDFKFNTAISALMILVNALEKEDRISDVTYRTTLILLAPFAPHIAEELWHEFGNTESIFLASWPLPDPKLLVNEEVTIVVSVNGKVRANIVVPSGSDEAVVKTLALENEKVRAFVEGKELRKTVFVSDKIINFVV